MSERHGLPKNDREVRTLKLASKMNSVEAISAFAATSRRSAHLMFGVVALAVDSIVRLFSARFYIHPASF